MKVLFFVAALAILALLAPFMGRAIIGPSIFDRVQALNGVGTLSPALIILVGLVYDRVDMFVDMALGLYLLNLFTTLLIARYVRDKTEAEKEAQAEP